MTISNAERAGLALWLMGTWGGSEDELSAFLDAWEGLRLEEFRKYVRPVAGGVQFDMPDDVLSEPGVDWLPSPSSVEVILANYPRSATPSGLGPAKVRLLRRLRELVSAQKKTT